MIAARLLWGNILIQMIRAHLGLWMVVFIDAPCDSVYEHHPAPICRSKCRLALLVCCGTGSQELCLLAVLNVHSAGLLLRGSCSSFLRVWVAPGLPFKIRVMTSAAVL